MTVKWDEVIAILEQDCKIPHAYINDAGETCAIGALALAAGVSPQALKVNGFNLSIVAKPDFAMPIMAKFGLTLDQQREIQRANDHRADDLLMTPEIRRRNVLNRVNELRWNELRRVV